MIYTVTLNPSLDYVVRVTDFEPGRLHRTESEELYAGGKGINVSVVLNSLGTKTTALGFVGGFTGMEIKRMLQRMGVPSDFITLQEGVSRINMKLISQDRSETEINGQGPAPGQKDLERLYQQLLGLCEEDILVLSGSVPKSMKDGEYS